MPPFAIGKTTDGSLYQGDNVGLDAGHHVPQFQARVDVLITSRVALGVGGSIFLRQSHCDVSGTACSREYRG